MLVPYLLYNRQYFNRYCLHSNLVLTTTRVESKRGVIAITVLSFVHGSGSIKQKKRYVMEFDFFQSIDQST